MNQFNIDIITDVIKIMHSEGGNLRNDQKEDVLHVLFEKYSHTNVIRNDISSYIKILYNLVWHTNGAFSYVIFVSQSMLPYLK